jgi:uncharacterized protein (TIGR03083 family)
LFSIRLFLISCRPKFIFRETNGQVYFHHRRYFTQSDKISIRFEPQIGKRSASQKDDIMSNQPTNQNQEQRYNKAELVERIDRSRSALEETLRPLSEEQLLTPGPSGWSIKDHLAHLAVWEFGVAELLQHRSRFAAMQVEGAVSQGKTEDEVNDVIYQRHADLSLAQVRKQFDEAHRLLLQALNPLSDADLYRPYASFVPGGDRRQDPVIYWIKGNTFEHFDEHQGYIRSLLEEIV